ncbi:MAG TPA: MFS transporter, partial [Thermomicrobiaceae bacterium]|nr:MFS transporter [Thermomicrobiaceae bacterium]
MDSAPTSQRTVIGAAALSAMLAPLNSTMIVVALPALLHQFDRSLAWGSWIIISYLVAMATVQPLSGSLGDRMGRRRLMLLGLVAFLAASLLAALAWNIEILLLARTAQAIAGAIAIPNGAALVRAELPVKRQASALGSIGGAVAIAAGLGPTLGGLLTDLAGWRWIFAANVVLILPALALLLRLSDRPVTGPARRFDLLGATLLTTTLVTLVLAVTLLQVPASPRALSAALAVLGLAGGAALLRHIPRSSHPLVSPALFRAPGYAAAVFGVLLTNLAMYTVLLSLPLFLAADAGWNPGATGLLLSGLSLQMVIFSPLGGRLADGRGFRLPAALGASLILLGLLPLLAISTTWGWPMYLGALILIGTGTGLATAPIQASALLAVPAAQAGQASGFYSTMRYLGSIAGSTLMAALLAGEHPALGHVRALYALLCLAAVAAIVVCTQLPGATRASTQPESLAT